MKYAEGRRATALFLTTLLILSFSTTALVIPRTVDGYSPRDQIVIDGDGDFTLANGVTGGTGTAVDPYTIEGWEIEVDDHHGIHVIGTNAHFIITDCMITFCQAEYSGIFLDRCSNASVDGNVVSFNSLAIKMTNCRNTTVSNNSLDSNNYCGVNFISCIDCRIHNNSITSTSGMGIDFDGTCSGTVISNNSLQLSGAFGIRAWYASSVEISGNNISGSAIGIELMQAHYMTLRANNLSNSLHRGFALYGTNAVLEGNILTNDSIMIEGAGDYLTSHTISTTNLVNGYPVYYYKNVSSLVVNDMPVGELIIVNCTDVHLTDLDCTSIFMAQTQDCIISECTTTHGDFGLDIENCGNVTVEDCETRHADFTGVYVFQCNWFVLKSSNVSQNRIGMYLEETNALIANNTFASSIQDGLRVHWTNGIDISGNEFEDNGDDGLYLWHSYDLDVTGNNFSSNGRAGLFCGYCEDLGVAGNNLSKNAVYGLLVEEQISDVGIVENTLTSNGDYGMYIDCWDWEYTWNVSVTDNDVSNSCEAGMYVKNVDGIDIQGNVIDSSTTGVALKSCDGAHLGYNNISHSGYCGMRFDDCANSTIIGNNLSANEVGVSLAECSNVTVFHNNFVSNLAHALNNNGGTISWDNGYPSGGNYWDNCSGIDEMSGPTQSEPGSDGIADTPHFVDTDVIDNYPLMDPYERPSTNTPPYGSFYANPWTSWVGVSVEFNASESYDMEDPIGSMELRWDWEDDGSWDTSWSTTRAQEHIYDEAGVYTVRLQVRDSEGLTDECTRDVTIVGGHEDVKLSLSIERSAYLPGQDISFSVELVNTGDGVAVLLFQSSQHVDFCVIDGEDVIVFDYSPDVIWALTTLILEPGEESSEELAWDQSGDGITVPGIYTIFASPAGYDQPYLTASTVVVIEDEKPITVANVDGEEGGDGWYTSTVGVSLEAVDGWSGVEATSYRIDGGDWITYTDAFDIAGDGTYVLEYYSEDVAGNAEDMQTIDIKVDSTAPTIEFLVGNGTEFQSDTVNIAWSFVELCSGLGLFEYSIDGSAFASLGNASFVLLSDLDDGTHVITVRATDLAGNNRTEVLVFEVEDLSQDDGSGALSQSAWMAIGLGAVAVAVIVLWLTSVKRRPKQDSPE